MINTTAAYKKAILADRIFKVEINITFADGGKLTLDNNDVMQGGLSFDEATSADNEFTIGAAVIGKCSFIVYNKDDKYLDYVFEGASVRPRIGLVLEDGSTEWLDKGIYTVDEAKYSEATISVSCLDNMVKFDKTCEALPYPATIFEILRNSCQVCGVTLATQEFPNRDYRYQKAVSSSLTHREIVSYVAQIAGCYAKINTNGQLELKWYDTSNVVQELEKLWSQDIALDDVVITGIKVSEESGESAHQYGADGYVLDIQRNPFIQEGKSKEVAEYLGKRINGLRFRPAKVTGLSDPSIQAGDVARLTDRKGNKHTVIWTGVTFTIGDAQSYKCSAKSAARNSMQRNAAFTQAINDAVEKEKTERERMQEEMAERIENAQGFHSTNEVDANGATILYLHDQKSLNESQNVFKFTSETISGSTDGGKTWSMSLSVDGQAIINILSAVGIDASWIRTGHIQSQNYTSGGTEGMRIDLDNGLMEAATMRFLGGGLSISGRTSGRSRINMLSTDGRYETRFEPSDWYILDTTTGQQIYVLPSYIQVSSNTYAQSQRVQILPDGIRFFATDGLNRREISYDFLTRVYNMLNQLGY